ncbi:MULTISPECIES: hypothetical protein [Mangrovimonas]|uniref:hypothetical protein n=2 Tax=Flavobacteriaceae TaxID=49546 RepID=UPI001E489110|nr:hypothetical protein [Mangrovimonas futianensis]
MFKTLRQNKSTRWLWGFMALYLLNISVDPSDIQPHWIPEDLSFNDQESIVEIVIEKVLGFENAFEEYDDNDTEEHSNGKQVKINLLIPYAHSNHLENVQFIDQNQHFGFRNAFLPLGYFEIDTPPPKV